MLNAAGPLDHSSKLNTTVCSLKKDKFTEYVIKYKLSDKIAISQCNFGVKTYFSSAEIFSAL